MKERSIKKLVLWALLETTSYSAMVAALLLFDCFVLKVRKFSFLGRENLIKAGIIYCVVFLAVLITLAVGGSSFRDMKPREVSHTMVAATITGLITLFIVTYVL